MGVMKVGCLLCHLSFIIEYGFIAQLTLVGDLIQCDFVNEGGIYCPCTGTYQQVPLHAADAQQLFVFGQRLTLTNGCPI